MVNIGGKENLGWFTIPVVYFDLELLTFEWDNSFQDKKEKTPSYWNVAQTCNVCNMETQIKRKWDFQRLSWDWMISCQEWNGSLSHLIFLCDHPLFPGGAQWDSSPCGQRLPFICTYKPSLVQLSLNHWWNLTGCHGIWNWVHLKYISAEKSFAWKNQGLIRKKKRYCSKWHFCPVCIIVVIFLQTILIMILLK